MSKLFRTTLFTLSTCMTLGSGAVYADHGRSDDYVAQLLLGIASSFLVTDSADDFASNRQERPRRDNSYRTHAGSGLDRSRANSPRDFGGRNFNRHDFGASFTSSPIRGGSSRRTRIIENPYPNRPVIGISFTGIDDDIVHINDVITYPRKRLVSHRGHSLSLYHPSPFLDTRGHVDFISVKAKRKAYFTVTFHYE